MEYPQSYLDDEGYPTDELLDWIKDYDIIESGLEPLLEIIEDTWNWPDWGIVRKRAYDGKFSYEMHTGGWSGNESIMQSLRSNMYFYMWWVKSTAGGHHYFRFPVESFFTKAREIQ